MADLLLDLPPDTLYVPSEPPIVLDEAILQLPPLPQPLVARADMNPAPDFTAPIVVLVVFALGIFAGRMTRRPPVG